VSKKAKSSTENSPQFIIDTKFSQAARARQTQSVSWRTWSTFMPTAGNISRSNQTKNKSDYFGQ